METKDTAAKANGLAYNERSRCNAERKTMQEIARQIVSAEDLAAIRKALEKKASKGNKEAMRLCRQYFGSVVEASSGSAASTLAEEDRLLLERVANRIKEKDPNF